jgi:ferrous-iron efflux pump FieF
VSAPAEALSVAAARAGRVAAAVAASLAVGKLLAGQLGHSVAVTASATDSLMDVFASSLNALAIRLASSAADGGHPFGHAKIEALAIAVQGLLIGGSGAYITLEGVGRLVRPEPLALPALTLGAMGVATLVTLALVSYLGRVAARTGSGAVRADSLHYRTDIGANLAVLLGTAATYLTGFARLDGLLSLGVAAYVLWSAGTLLRESLRDLLDESPPPERLAPIVAALDALRADGTLAGYHALRARTSGARMFVEVHVELSGDLSLREAHARGDLAEAAVRKADPDAEVLVHVDPERDEPALP